MQSSMLMITEPIFSKILTIGNPMLTIPVRGKINTVYHKKYTWFCCALFYCGFHVIVVMIYPPSLLFVVASQSTGAMIDPNHKSNNATDKYPTMHQFVTEMCTFLLQNGALWDMRLVHYGICATGLLIWLRQCQWNNPEGYGLNWTMSNHNKTQQSMNHVHNSWDVLYKVYGISILVASPMSLWLLWWPPTESSVFMVS